MLCVRFELFVSVVCVCGGVYGVFEVRSFFCLCVVCVIMCISAFV